MNGDDWEDALRLGPEAFCRKAHLDYDDWLRVQQKPDYVRFTIPKRSGGERVIHTPRKRVKRLQRQLIWAMEAWYYERLPDCVYGFVPAEASRGVPRHVMTNAGRHGASQYLLNIDIEDFFPSITRNRLRERWLMVWPHTQVELLEGLLQVLTYKGKLPTGAPSSPLLSNWFVLDLDRSLTAFAKTEGLVYTRYVDDLSFSGDRIWPAGREAKLEAIIADYGLGLNKDKRRWYGLGEEKVVTGIRFSGGLALGLHVEKDFVKNLRRCMLSYQRHLAWGEVSGGSPWMKQKLVFLRGSIRGQLAYCAQVQGEDNELLVKLREEWSAVKRIKPTYFDGYHRIS